jgi:hypothetical protein
MSAVSPEDGGGLLLTTVKGLLFAADMQKRALLDAPKPPMKTRAPVSGVASSSAATDQLMSIMRAGSTQGMDPCVDMQLRNVLEVSCDLQKMASSFIQVPLTVLLHLYMQADAVRTDCKGLMCSALCCCIGC